MARSGGGAVLAYFFLGKIRRPDRADWITKVYDTALTSGEWPLLGQLRGCDESEWVNPLFQNDMLEGAPVEVSGYLDEDLRHVSILCAPLVAVVPALVHPGRSRKRRWGSRTR